MSTGSKTPIPGTVQKTIQDIKEITNDSEEEIYAMLKECKMDPNVTTEKLLNQDTFREVKKKRDKKKENISNREPVESRLRPGLQGRSRGCRGNYSPRFTSHDAGGSRNSTSGKLNGANQVSEKGVTPSSLPNSQESKNKEAHPEASSTPAIVSGPIEKAVGKTAAVHDSQSTARSVKQPEVTSAGLKLGCTPLVSTGAGEGQECQPQNPSSSSISKTLASSTAVCFSSSDPVLVPSHDSRLPAAVGTIKREVGSKRAIVESNPSALTDNKIISPTSEVGSSLTEGKMSGKPQGVGKGQTTESPPQPLPSSAQSGSTVNHPVSGHSRRTQQTMGPQKVSSKEWKPKPMNLNSSQGCGVAVCEVRTACVEADSRSSIVSSLPDSEGTSKMQKKLDELHLPDRKHSDQHVIIPNHIHVPESERTKFSFGSIDAWFGVSTSHANDLDSGRTSTPSSETSQGFGETAEMHSSSNQGGTEHAEDEEYPAHPQSPAHTAETEDDGSSGAVPEYTDTKQETALPPGGHQHSAVHTSPAYSFGITQIPSEGSDSQARDLTRLPSFVVQHPIDPASYYAQLYRSNMESDGRISPFQTPGVAAKYNGNVTVLSAQASQSSQEAGNSMVLSTAGPTPLVTQAAGVMQNSIAVTQQPIPVFRHPSGLHLSHYPPNYIPYGHYFSPFYVPPPAIHQLLSNGAFPQQPQAANMYPPPPPPAAAGVKYSISQYKPGANMGNHTPIGMPSNYGSYGSAAANFSPSSATTAGNSASNEDLSASQYKENSTYATGQQSEGSAVWIAAPGRDISGLQASSFYNLPPQGQHVTFAPTQAAHGAFASVYHPAHTVTAGSVHPLLQQPQSMAGAADMGGPTANVFQQPQHAQMNWPNSY